MANTLIELNDTPSSYAGGGLKFLRINAGETGISFAGADLNALVDVDASGGYAPSGGDVLQYSAGAGKWRPADNDPYSAGNGLNKSAKTLNVVATGGLVSNSSGVYIADIDNVAGVYGNSTAHAVITVNSKGQITSVTETASTVSIAETLQADYVGNVNGTIGQITVVGGKGNNSNATLNLVATGVTSGVYGNATHAPQITVDSYGRLQNVDLIEISGGGGGVSGANASLSFSSIAVAGQTTVSAESAEDRLTFVAGSGLTLSTDPSTDSITFTADTQAIASGISAGELADINISGITDGQIVRWVAANSAFEAFDHNDNPGIALTDLSAGTGLAYNGSTGEYKLADTAVVPGVFGGQQVTPQITVDAQGRITNVSNVAQSPSGVVAGTYGNATLIPQITVNQYGVVTALNSISGAAYIQSLGWNSATNVLALSGANSVDLSSLVANTFKTIQVSGQQNIVADNAVDTLNIQAGTGISITTNSATDTLTITNSLAAENSGVAAGTYGTASVMPQFSVDARGRITSVSNISIPSELQTIAYDENTKTLSLSDGNSVDLGSLSDDEHYVFNKIYVPGQGTVVADNYTDGFTLVGGAGVSITTNTSTDTITITATGGGSGGGGSTDLTSFSVVESTPNGQGNLSYNNQTGVFTFNPADLSNVVGGQTLSLDNSTNVLTISETLSTVDLTTVLANSGTVGPQGPQGETGPAGADGSNGTNGVDGVDVSSAAVVGTDLILTLSDASTINAGNVVGPQGIAGVGITNVTLVGANLVLDYSNTSTQDVGNIQGPQGDQGLQGLHVSSATVTLDNLIFTMSDASTIDAGNVRGPVGPQGEQGIQGDGNAGISSATVTGDNLILTLTDTSTIDAGNVRGPAGPQGEPGAQGIQGETGPAGADGADGVTQDLTGYATETYVNNAIGALVDSDNQQLTLVENTLNISGGNSVDLSGLSGSGGIALTDLSVTTASADAGGALSYNDGTGVFTFTPPDLSSYLTSETDSQTLSISGNVITISGSSSTVDLTSAIASGAGGGGGTTYTGSTGITVDNTADTIALANTAVAPGTYGSATRSPVITVDQQGRITSVTNATIASGGGGGGGGTGAKIERFRLNYTSAGQLAGTASLTEGISGVTINSTSGGEVTIEFTGYNLPPGSIMFYGYDHTNNKYSIVPMETSMGFREIPGGGSSGSPTLFNGGDVLQVKLRLREAETGASRGGFGTTTHAWIQFMMYD